MEMNETLTLAAVTVPEGVTLLDDLDETVIATITPPTLEPVEEEIETETALVGEDGEPLEGAELEEAERQAEGDTADEAAQASGDDELKLFSSTPVDWLVVGLGNPGTALRQHARTTSASASPTS